MILRRAILSFALFAFAAPALAKAPQFAPAPPPRPAYSFPTGEEIVTFVGLSGDVTFAVIDLDTGLLVEGRGLDLPLPPASVAKAPTALYALDALGPDHRFETRVIAVGERSGGVLTGDLILQGGGDPEADTVTLDGLARAVASAGLRKVEGRFLIDDGLLPSIERIDGTQPEYAAYNPSVGALNLNYNRVHAEWRRGANGYAMSVEARAEGLSPPTDAAVVRIVETTTSGGVFDYRPGATPEAWTVARKALGKRGARWLPVRRPSDYAAATFRTLASGAGLALPNPVTGRSPVVADVIARATSRPLRSILRDMLRYSTNLTAEAAGLAASRTRRTPDGLAGSAAQMNAWAAAFAGFPAGDPGFQLVNHSGLSGDSRASARRLVEILAAADRRGFPGLGGGGAATLRGLLPEKPYLEEGKPRPPVEAVLRAKTGTMNFASALAGYIDTGRGRRLAFAILTADVAKREAIRNRQIESPRGSRSWAARSRQLQRALIRSWIARFGGAENDDG